LRQRTADGQPDGPAVPDYYPGVITEAEWLAARAGVHGRDGAGDRRRTRQRRFVNVFNGLLRNAAGAEGFVLRNRGTRAEPKLVLPNAAGEAGGGASVSFNYAHFEAAVLELLAEIDPAELAPRDAAAADRLGVLRARAEFLDDQAAQVQAELKK